MPDKHTKEVRSMNMSHIRSRDTKPEETVRKYLFSKGLRYRKNVRKLPGCPDIVLKKYNAAVFVNGCFWHRHDCGRFVWPSSNAEYWRSKIERNTARDQESCRQLTAMGWRVFVIWECQLKRKEAEKNLEALFCSITNGKKQEAEP